MKIPTLKNVYDQNTTEAVSNDYPYGRLRCTAKWWIEDNGKKGQRICFQTINPKNQRVNAPKKGTYQAVIVLVKNEENGHFEHHSVSAYTDTEKLKAFIEKYDLREQDEKFLNAWIKGREKLDAHYAANPIKFVITETAPVDIFKM